MPHIVAEQMSVSLSAGRRFRRTEVLREISFTLTQGDRLAIVGSNGAGKSTLLRVLAGVLFPSKGRLSIEGETSALFNVSLGTRRQSTGRRNMIIRSLLEGRPYHEVMAKLDEMIAFADIGEKIDAPMETYSQGMAMRAVFAAATSFDPEILLLDEWIGAGDLAFREKSRDRMMELVERSGIIVLATHRKGLSISICNRGLYMKSGRIAYLGSVEEAWERYEADGGKHGRPSVVPRKHGVG